MKQLLLGLFLTTLSISTAAQQRLISGSVKDVQTQQSIGFCSIFQIHTENGTMSDSLGNFKLTLPQKSDSIKLVFEVMGYQTDTLLLKTDQNTFTVYLKRQSTDLKEVVITGKTQATLIRENPLPITPISSSQIEATVEPNIMDVLTKNVPGLNTVKTGPNISKPFIHGLGYNRVLTLYDGLRQEGQQWGDEHGIEVDDYNIERVEVIKGPASLLYGSDAVAGVISLYPFVPTQNDGKLHGRVVSEYQTNNNLIGDALRLSYVNQHFLLAVNGSYKMAKNYRNPVDGRVYLTNFRENNFSALAGYKTQKGITRVNFTLYDNHQGIPDGSRDSLTRKFTKQVLDQGDDILHRPIVSQQELNAYKIPDLSQHIQYYRAYVQSSYQVGTGNLSVLLGGQQSIRREFSHPEEPKQAGMFVRLNTFNYDFKYDLPKLGNFMTSVGINGMLQNNKNENATDFPIPDYSLYEGGAYWFEKWQSHKWTLSGGIRYDLRQVVWGDFYVATNPVTGFEQKSESSNPAADLRFPSFKKLYRGLSGSVGASFDANQHLTLKANLGRAYRAPNITEVGSNGLDPGAHIIYLGDRSFKPEFSVQEDVGVVAIFPDFSAEIGLYNNNIQNYIFMSAIADAQGVPILDAQGNRTYQYEQSRAQLYGGEATFSIHPTQLKGFEIENNMSLVYGFNRKKEFKGKRIEGEYLPMIPPLMINSGISQAFEFSSNWITSLTPKFEVEYAGAQNRYLGLNGTETATPSYTLFNLGLSSEFKYSKTNVLQLMLQVNNLFNTAYQSNLSRLKYFEYYSYSPTGRYGIFNMGRNIAIKVIMEF